METIEFKKVGHLSMFADYYPPKENVINKNTYIIFMDDCALMLGSRTCVPNWQVEKFNEAGYGFFSIDFRLITKTLFYEVVMDVYNAIVYLKEYINELNNKPGKIVAMGQSAGGFLSQLPGNFKRK